MVRYKLLGATCALVFALLGSAVSAQSPCDDPGAARTPGPVALAYRDLGEVDHPAVLLVGGTDQQLIDWPDGLVDGLKARGFRPIVYDARDVGCSTTFAQAGAPDWATFFGKLMTGQTPETAYTLRDLTGDLFKVADALGVERFHVIAASGGTAVAGSAAAARPERVASLVLFAPNSGDPTIPLPAKPAVMAAVPPAPAAHATPEAIVAYRVTAATALEGSTMRTSDAALHDRAVAATARAWIPDGTARTGAALIAAGDLRPRFRTVTAPTVVVHGAEDPLIAPAHGRQVAEAVPGARFREIAGLGHALPSPAVAELLSAFDAVSGQAAGDHP